MPAQSLVPGILGREEMGDIVNLLKNLLHAMEVKETRVIRVGEA
jgi:hypothetical protein